MEHSFWFYVAIIAVSVVSGMLGGLLRSGADYNTTIDAVQHLRKQVRGLQDDYNAAKAQAVYNAEQAYAKKMELSKPALD